MTREPAERIVSGVQAAFSVLDVSLCLSVSTPYRRRVPISPRVGTGLRTGLCYLRSANGLDTRRRTPGPEYWDAGLMMAEDTGRPAGASATRHHAPSVDMRHPGAEATAVTIARNAARP